MLAPAKPDRELRAILDHFLAQTDTSALAAGDPVALLSRYDDPHDQEVAGLIVASLAYGRVASIKSKAGSLLESLGPNPAVSVDSRKAPRAAQGFVYRFQRGDDLPRFLEAVRRIRRREGSLASAFAKGIRQEEPDYGDAVDRFVRRLTDEIDGELTPGLRFLLPRCGKTGGAAKRPFLYLRWMVRPSGPADLGAWQALAPGRVDPAKLLIPLDTHIARIARYVGLTDRRTNDLATAREITRALARFRPDDPLVYDIALCHLGISGLCPTRREVERCADCAIRAACRLGSAPAGWV